MTTYEIPATTLLRIIAPNVMQAMRLAKRYRIIGASVGGYIGKERYMYELEPAALRLGKPIRRR